MKNRSILVALPETWVIKLNDRARHFGLSRNGLVRQYLRQALNRSPSLELYHERELQNESYEDKKTTGKF